MLVIRSFDNVAKKNLKINKRRKIPSWWSFVRAIWRFSVLEIKNTAEVIIHRFWFNDNKDLSQPALTKLEAFEDIIWDGNRARLDNLYAVACQCRCFMHLSPWHRLRYTKKFLRNNFFFDSLESNFQSAALVHGLFVFSACRHWIFFAEKQKTFNRTSR